MNIKPHSCNPNNTYYIHSCVSRHVTCIEQKSVHSVKVSTMAAICYLPHQVLQHPTQFKNKKNRNQNQIPNTHYHKNGKWNRKKSNTNHNSPVLGLDFTNSSFLIVDRQLVSLICSNGYSISNKTQNKYNLKIGTRDFETSCVDI